MANRLKLAPRIHRPLLVVTASRLKVAPPVVTGSRLKVAPVMDNRLRHRPVNPSSSPAVTVNPATNQILTAKVMVVRAVPRAPVRLVRLLLVVLPRPRRAAISVPLMVVIPPRTNSPVLMIRRLRPRNSRPKNHSSRPLRRTSPPSPSL